MEEVKQKSTSRKGATVERAMTKVRPEEKQSTASLTLIWVGGVISAPALMVGAILISGVSLGMTVLITAIAFVIQVFLMCLNGMQASDTGYPLTVLLGKTFGDTGSRYILATLITLSQTLQAAVQVAVCGGAFAVSMASLGIPIPLWISILLWGAVMVITAVYGFGWMKVLNYIAVPFLIIVCVYATIQSSFQFGINEVLNYTPETSMGFIEAISIMIGLFAAGTIVCTDLTRYAKSRKATVVSSVFGILPGTLLMITMGAIMSITANTSDMTELFVKLGLPVLGMFALVLATWTTNTTNFYQGGLAFTRLCGVSDDKRSLLTAITGIVATLLAMVGISEIFVPILNVTATLIPPIAGIMIADYWNIGKGKKENWGIVPGLNYIGLGAWALGTAVGFFVPFFSPSFNSIVVGMIAYIALHYAFGKKLPAVQDPVKFIGE